MSILKHPASHTFGRPAPMGRLAIAAIGLIAIAIATGCGVGGSDTKEFSSPVYPFSFEHPSDWTTSRNATLQFGGTSGIRTIAVQLKLPYNQAVISQYRLKRTLPPGVPANKKEIDRIVDILTKQSGGTASDGVAVTVGGIPGYQYTIEYSAGNTDLQNQVTFLFSGQDEFQINCQSTPDKRDEMAKGCKQILDTLKFA